MKIKTFRNILIIICILNFIFGLNYEEKLLSLVFNMQEPTAYSFSSIAVMFRLVAFPFVLICFLPLFKSYGYNKMTKKTYSIFIPIFTFILIFPFLFYPSRTETTANSIKEHNFIGKVSNVYLYEDAKKVTVELSATGGSPKHPNPRIHISCGIEFEDGTVYYFTQADGDIGWKVMEKINRLTRDNKIEKEVSGEALYNKLSEYNNYYEFLGHTGLVRSLIRKQ